MIAQLRGQIAWRDDKSVILDVAGVGYRVYLSTSGRAAVAKQEAVTLWTHLAVRENALDLFGSPDKAEIDFLELLITVPGIGPKSALAILSLAPPTTLRRAVVEENVSYLTQVSGIGRKSAEKIIVNLKDRVGIGALEQAGELGAAGDLLAALQALGYNLAEARIAVRQVPTDISDERARLRAALKILGRAKN
mgnify:CR=1 FL=1